MNGLAFLLIWNNTTYYNVIKQGNVHLIWKTLSPVVSNEGLILTPTTTLAECPPLDVICVPGGGIGQVEVMQDAEILNFLKQQSITAQYVTSVCTGSLILAAAGLLQGYKAAFHWAFRDQLAMLGVEVIPQRVVIDRNRVTGAGVTSGIDFGLTLLELLCGEKVAKMTQLMMDVEIETDRDLDLNRSLSLVTTLTFRLGSL